MRQLSLRWASVCPSTMLPESSGPLSRSCAAPAVIMLTIIYVTPSPRASCAHETPMKSLNKRGQTGKISPNNRLMSLSDMEGVRGSIPLPPTIHINILRSH